MTSDGMDSADFDDEHMGPIVVCEIRVSCTDGTLNRHMHDLFYIFPSCVARELCLTESLKHRECCCSANVLVKYIDLCTSALIPLLFGCPHSFALFSHHACFVLSFF